MRLDDVKFTYLKTVQFGDSIDLDLSSVDCGSYDVYMTVVGGTGDSMRLSVMNCSSLPASVNDLGVGGVIGDFVLGTGAFVKVPVKRGVRLVGDCSGLGVGAFSSFMVLGYE